jgi:hypothetical protein
MWPKSLHNPVETPATISAVARTALKHRADGRFDTQTISMETTLVKLTGFETRVQTGTTPPTGETAFSLLGTIAGKIQRTLKLVPDCPT